MRVYKAFFQPITTRSEVEFELKQYNTGVLQNFGFYNSPVFLYFQNLCRTGRTGRRNERRLSFSPTFEIGSVPNTGRSIKSYMINFCIGTFLKLEWHLSILQRK